MQQGKFLENPNHHLGQFFEGDIHASHRNSPSDKNFPWGPSTHEPHLVWIAKAASKTSHHVLENGRRR